MAKLGRPRGEEAAPEHYQVHSRIIALCIRCLTDVGKRGIIVAIVYLYSRYTVNLFFMKIGGKSMKKSMKEINRQLNKEALLTLGLFLLFFPLVVCHGLWFSGCGNGRFWDYPLGFL